MSDTSARSPRTGRRSWVVVGALACVAAIAVGWFLQGGNEDGDDLAGNADWKAAAARSLAGPPKVLWEKTYGGSKIDAARAIRRLPGGGFAIAARTRSRGAGKDDIWLLRLNREGKVIWQKTFGHSGKDWSTALAVMADGGFALAGSMEKGTPSNIAARIIRTDSAGKVRWQKEIGGIRLDGLTAIMAMPDGGVLAAGSISSKGAGGFDAWLLRFDSRGELLMEKYFGGKAEDSAFAAIALKDGYVLAGSTSSKGAGDGDMWLLRLDGSGKLMWERTYGGAKYDVANVLIAVNGGYFLAGHSASGEKPLPYVVRVDAEGKTLWTRRIPMAFEGWANSAALLADGGFVIAGLAKNSAEGDENGWLARLDSKGKVLWVKFVAHGKDDNLLSVVPLPDGGFMAAGFTNSKGAGGGDVWLVRFGYPKPGKAK